jgi:hypothetical protein
MAATDIRIVDNQFVFKQVESSGTVIVEATFEDESFCYGVVRFPKGLVVGDSTLTRDVTIKWTATYAK